MNMEVTRQPTLLKFFIDFPVYLFTLDCWCSKEHFFCVLQEFKLWKRCRRIAFICTLILAFFFLIPFLCKCPIKLVWPSVEAIRTSNRGYSNGGSIPFNEKTYAKYVHVPPVLVHLRWFSNRINQVEHASVSSFLFGRNTIFFSLLFFFLLFVEQVT